MISGKSELSIFDTAPPQAVIESGIFQDIHPTTALDSKSPVIEFVIQGSQNEYLDLNDVLLSLKVKLTKQDDTAFKAADADQPIPCNYFMNALFTDVSMELNDVQIEGGTNMYPYKATIENALNFNDDAKRIQLLPAGVSQEETERASWGANSQIFELVGALRLDFLNQPKYLLPGVNVRFRLTQSKDHFPLQLPSTKKDDGTFHFKTLIAQAILYVRRVKVHPSVHEGHRLGLSKQNAVYPYTKSKCLYYSIPTGTNSFVKENLFSSGSLPKFIVIGFVDAQAFNGHLDKPPFHFEHFKVNHIALYRDGQAIPYKRPYNPQFKQNNNLITDTYVRSILQNTQLLNTNYSNGIDMQDFLKNGYCLFTFNLTPDFEINQPQMLNDANLRLDIRFAAPLASAINVVCYAIYDANLYITKDRQIITDAFK